MKIRVYLNESSDAEVLTKFLQIFKPSIDIISLKLPNNISDKVLKEMFKSLTFLSEKVCLIFFKFLWSEVNLLYEVLQLTDFIA